MRNFTWNRFPIKNLLIDSLLTPIVESTYLNRDMCKFESSQKDESRWQSTDSSKAYRNTSAFKCTLVEYGTRCLYEDANFYSVLIVRSASWLKLTSSHFRKCCEENFYLCVRIMQNLLKIFSTAAKLLVRRLRLRVQKAQSPHYWQVGGKNLKSVNHYKYLGAVLSTEYWALRWQRHS